MVTVVVLMACKLLDIIRMLYRCMYSLEQYAVRTCFGLCGLGRKAQFGLQSSCSGCVKQCLSGQTAFPYVGQAVGCKTVLFAETCKHQTSRI
jgi:hypothetical protein